VYVFICACVRIYIRVGELVNAWMVGWVNLSV